MYRNYAELMASAREEGSLAKAVLLDEVELSGRTEEEVYERLEARWRVMELSAQRALDEPQEKTEAVPTQTKGVSRTFKIAAVILIAALILLLFFVILMYMKNRHSMPQQSNDGYYLYVMSKIQPYING